MRLFPFLMLAPLLGAQDRPQFIWQGDVDGAVILHLRADRLDVQVAEGAPVAGQQFHYYDRLPESHQNARLEVREGRGYVHIIDQPRSENQYTLAVSIEDRQPGASFYSIALYWDTSNRDVERQSGRIGKVAWRGRVDREALISCQDKTCASSAGAGAPVADEHFKFSRALPRREVEVSLDSQEGRGEIRLVEQPSERNHYTTRVSIRDPQGGSGEYAFTLAWRERSNKERLPDFVAEPGLIWNAAVSGNARVTIAGGSALSEGTINGEHAEFLRPLPARSDLKPAVKKLSGRGRVEIIEFPSEKNNYHLVFQIVDSQTSPSNYQIEVDW